MHIFSIKPLSEAEEKRKAKHNIPSTNNHSKTLSKSLSLSCITTQLRCPLSTQRIVPPICNNRYEISITYQSFPSHCVDATGQGRQANRDAAEKAQKQTTTGIGTGGSAAHPAAAAAGTDGFRCGSCRRPRRRRRWLVPVPLQDVAEHRTPVD